jgi:hypothetical protein
MQQPAEQGMMGSDSLDDQHAGRHIPQKRHPPMLNLPDPASQQNPPAKIQQSGSSKPPHNRQHCHNDPEGDSGGHLLLQGRDGIDVGVGRV